jgi:hypothetical protein
MAPQHVVEAVSTAQVIILAALREIGERRIVSIGVQI